ncbi:anti-sigma F factor antagonist (stage II sporulation protein AA) [Anaerovibrio sp. JC8]|uniref:STAS domain-containing protein n=1 Tax=Anaerovibrio sp. JC8 TaxID=1240085 RepID=UPI000A0DE4F5|nr:STAS domain-containing protein [Anaerovibrio sp. JC8]ORT99747.1 anti-sigma F factor antagonist (stage II sporulation protein AA) [Anaerovibrio sp. JC8]
MEIKKEKNGSALTLTLIGKLSIQEAKDLSKVVDEELTDITDLTLDFKDLTYVSSAGLRVLLTAQNIMDDAEGEMKLINVPPFIVDVLKLTGFNKFMNIVD